MRSEPAALGIQEVQDCVLGLFCASTDGRVPLQPSPGETPDVLLDGLLFQFPMMVAPSPTTGRGGSAVWLRMFVGLGGLAQQLWQQEVRSLIRLSGTEHAALPTIRDGGIRSWSGIADGITRKIGYVVTDRSAFVLQDDAMAALRSQPLEAVRHLRLLADALRVLHGNSLVHRNLWQGPLRISRACQRTKPRSDTPLTFKLS